MSIHETAKKLGLQEKNDVYMGRINNIQEEILLLTAIVNQHKTKPFYRQLATQIINSFPCQHKNYDCYVFAIAKWVRENIKYIKDITGYETLQTPDNTLKIGGGDCDDHAILVATLLQSIGIKATFKIVGEKGRYKHIYVIATTPKGKKWVIDTTEEHFFYPEKDDEEYEMEILQELEGLEELGFKFKFKPTKAFKRATGGIRRPKKFIKRIKRKPLGTLNKTFRHTMFKPTKAFKRAVYIKPIRKQIIRLEKKNPLRVRKFKPVKAIKRATASKSIDEALVKAGIAAGAAAVAAPAVAKATVAAAPAVSKTVETVATTTANILPSGVSRPQPQPNQQIEDKYLQILRKLEEKLQEKDEKQKTEELYKNPFVVAAGILTLGLILGGRQ
ncbi:transglutaminase-like domain-containing protein [Persephonella sp.]